MSGNIKRGDWVKLVSETGKTMSNAMFVLEIHHAGNTIGACTVGAVRCTPFIWLVSEMAARGKFTKVICHATDAEKELVNDMLSDTHGEWRRLNEATA